VIRLRLISTWHAREVSFSLGSGFFLIGRGRGNVVQINRHGNLSLYSQTSEMDKVLVWFLIRVSILLQLTTLISTGQPWQLFFLIYLTSVLSFTLTTNLPPPIMSPKLTLKRNRHLESLTKSWKHFSVFTLSFTSAEVNLVVFPKWESSLIN